jgi:hypothetical protein
MASAVIGDAAEIKRVVSQAVGGFSEVTDRALFEQIAWVVLGRWVWLS